MNDNAYFKDFTDVIDNEPEHAKELAIINFTYVRESSKLNAIYSRFKVLDINATNVLALYINRKKTMPSLGKLGLKTISNI
jgi:hypothetical protein